MKLMMNTCFMLSLDEWVCISKIRTILLFPNGHACLTGYELFGISMHSIKKCTLCSVYSKEKDTVYPKKYAHGFVVLCFVVVMQSFIMNSLEVFIHIHQGCFAGTGAIVRLPQCQWSKPVRYGKINQCITTTKHSKAKTVCIFLRIYCNWTICLHTAKILNHIHNT